MVILRHGSIDLSEFNRFSFSGVFFFSVTDVKAVVMS